MQNKLQCLLKNSLSTGIFWVDLQETTGSQSHRGADLEPGPKNVFLPPSLHFAHLTIRGGDTEVKFM